MYAIRNAKITSLVIAFGAGAIVMSTPCVSHAEFLPVYGGLTHSPGGDWWFPKIVTMPNPNGNSFVHSLGQVNNFGMAAGTAHKYDASLNYLGERAVRWDASGAATELGHLGTSFGFTLATASAINDAGTAVGIARKVDGAGNIGGFKAVRWEPSETAAIELASLGTSPDGSTGTSFALAINSAGTAVGTASEFDSAGNFVAIRAVRWDASGQVTALPGTRINPNDVGYAINDAGAVAGSGLFDAGGEDGNGLQFSAYRWDASGTTATKLDETATGYFGFSEAYAINDAGTAVGFAVTSEANTDGFAIETRAIRWDAASAAAFELGILPGLAGFKAYGINEAGMAVGSANKHDGSGNNLGVRAMRWDASGIATELGNLGTDLRGYADDYVAAINAAGNAVGMAPKFDDSGSSQFRAVYWGADAVAVDLNTLIDPNSGWELRFAFDISDTGWIAGGGVFDPDGPGGEPAYDRHFLIHLPAAIPEPSSVLLLGTTAAVLTLLAYRRDCS